MNKAIKQRTTRPSSGLGSPLRNFLTRGIFDDLFDQYMTDPNEGMAQFMNVSMDVAETEQAFEIKVDLPGIVPDHVEIQVDNNTLTIRGTRQVEKEDSNEDRQYHRMERYSGSFSRSVILPNSINEEEAAAEFKDGVLCIVIPKSEEAKPRKITITK